MMSSFTFIFGILTILICKESFAVLPHSSIHGIGGTSVRRRGCTNTQKRNQKANKPRSSSRSQRQLIDISNKAWPPFPFNLLNTRKQREQQQDDSSSPKSEGKKIGTTITLPGGADLFFNYCLSRGKIGLRQLQSAASSLALHLPPAAPPLVLLGLLPVEKQQTSAAVLHRFSQRLALTCLGISVISWAHCELRKNQRLTPLPLRFNSMLTTADEWSTVLPPFLPEAVTLPTMVTNMNYTTQQQVSIDIDNGTLPSAEGLISTTNQSMLSFQNWQRQIFQKTKRAPQTFAATCQEWQRLRIMRRNERLQRRRLDIYEQLVAFQNLKRTKPWLLEGRQAEGEEAFDRNPLGWALVTGASRGIGRAIAVELARWEIPLVLVARDLEKLKLLAIELGQCYGVPCCVLQADLTKPGIENSIHCATQRAGINVEILVNNAGLAYCGGLVDTELGLLENVMQLNAHAVTCLTRLYGKEMKDRRRGRILFVSSVTGAFPGVPGSAVYAASKAYQRSLATSLAKELEPHGVGVTHMLPGAVHGTQFGQESNIQHALCWKYPFYSRTSQEVASRGVRALLSGDTEVIPGFINRLWLKVFQPMLPQRISIMVAEISWSPFHINIARLLFSPMEKNPRNIASPAAEQNMEVFQHVFAPNTPTILTLDSVVADEDQREDNVTSGSLGLLQNLEGSQP